MTLRLWRRNWRVRHAPPRGRSDCATPPTTPSSGAIQTPKRQIKDRAIDKHALIRSEALKQSGELLKRVSAKNIRYVVLFVLLYEILASEWSLLEAR